MKEERKKELEEYLGTSTSNPSNKELEEAWASFEGDSHEQQGTFYRRTALLRIRRDMLNYDKISTGQGILRTMKEKGMHSGKIIDYGCGVSDYGLVFAEAGYDVIIVDFPEILDFAVWRYTRRGLKVSTIEVSKDNFYPVLPRVDLIIFGDVLEHFPEPLIVLENAYNSLNDEGYIYTSGYPLDHFTKMGDHLVRNEKECKQFLETKFKREGKYLRRRKE